MKFEKFIKICGARGTIVDCDDWGKFLKLANVFVAIPDGVNVVAPLKIDAPEWVFDVFDAWDDENVFDADLIDAKLPTPDASASSIVRIFGNGHDGELSVKNKVFGIIERSDNVYTYCENDDASNVTALVVTTGFGDNEMIVGIIFDEQYYTKKLIEEGVKPNGN